MKNIVICCDGTWNTPEQEDSGVNAPTNVFKISELARQVDATSQHVFYQEGVGTGPGFLDKAFGGGIGAGLRQNIREAYAELCTVYEPGDKLFLFGFSRGAYTVRSLAGFASRCGLLNLEGLDEAEVEDRVEKAFKDGYRDRNDAWNTENWPLKPVIEGIDPLSTESVLPLHFIGVWDTVGALGVPGHLGVLDLLNHLTDHQFHDTVLGANVAIARHAVALDETRIDFQPTLWRLNPNSAAEQDVVQKWFPGVHSDVGGGYAEAGLSDGAYQWMIEAAQAAGLILDTDMAGQITPNPQGHLHQSAKGVFGIFPTRPRTVPEMGLNKTHASTEARRSNPPPAQAPYRPSQCLDIGAILSVEVMAEAPWFDTGLYMRKDERFELVATGEWHDASIKCGPNGTHGSGFQLGRAVHFLGSGLGKIELLLKRLKGTERTSLPLTKRREKEDWFRLLGAIANQDYFAEDETDLQHVSIGTGTTVTARASGYFYAYANDAWGFYKNNTGSVTLTIKRVA